MACSACAAGNDWPCDWFGWGCSEGEQNAVLLDVGRQSTNTGFLFFSGDSAVIRRTLEFTFSNRSIRKGDFLKVQVRADGLPDGVEVHVDGKPCLAPASVEIKAVRPVQRVELMWLVPPTGADVDLKGVVDVTPVGFDRAGSMPLKGKAGKTLEFIRIQGEVDDDWHWAKRVTFWFWVVVLTSLGLWKFFLAPVFFHRRLKIHGGRMRCYEDVGSAGQPLEEVGLRGWGKLRSVHLTNQRLKKSPWKEFLHGRSKVIRMECIGSNEFKILKGGTSRRRGLKMQVLRKQGPRWIPASVYSKRDAAENRIRFDVEGKAMFLEFDFE